MYSYHVMARMRKPLELIDWVVDAYKLDEADPRNWRLGRRPTPDEELGTSRVYPIVHHDTGP
jgi:hypothetical protein